MTYIINRFQCQYFKKLQISLSIVFEKSEETIDYITFAFFYGYNKMTVSNDTSYGNFFIIIGSDFFIVLFWRLAK